MQGGAISGSVFCSRILQSAAREENQTRDLPITGQAALPPELRPHKHEFTQKE